MIGRRIGLLFGVFFCLLGVAGARTAYFATIKGGSLKQAATTQQVDVESVPARRGTIVDREGVELAVSEAADNVFATPYLVKDAEATAHKLAPLLKKQASAIADAIITARGKSSGFVYLARGVPAARSQKITKLELPGIALEPTMNRVYPRDWLASQVLGSTNIDGKGIAGLEYRFDERLRGSDGKRRIVKDGVNQALSINDVKPATSGKTLRLSLDAAIQARAEEVLGQIGVTYRPKGATAIVMDPRTGELLAVANWPRIDANAPLSASPPYSHENRAVSYLYEPGSTFKAFTVAGALAEGAVTPTTEFDLPPTISRYDRTVRESHRTAAVRYNTAQILAESSNVGAIKIGYAEGEKNFDKWVDRFRFGHLTGVDLPGEAQGIVPRLSKAQYSGTSMLNLPIGQGLAVTPMQMAAAYAAIANGGKLVTPRIVNRIGGEAVAHPAARRVISPTVARQLRTMLKGVFGPTGTASEVAIPGYVLAGKTGTANKVDPKTRQYTDKYVASFVGFAPALNPKLLVSVMVDEPQTDIYGGTVAAPAFGDIMSFALQYLKIPPK